MLALVGKTVHLAKISGDCAVSRAVVPQSGHVANVVPAGFPVTEVRLTCAPAPAASLGQRAGAWLYRVLGFEARTLRARERRRDELLEELGHFSQTDAHYFNRPLLELCDGGYDAEPAVQARVREALQNVRATDEQDALIFAIRALQRTTNPAMQHVLAERPPEVAERLAGQDISVVANAAMACQRVAEAERVATGYRAFGPRAARFRFVAIAVLKELGARV